MTNFKKENRNLSKNEYFRSVSSHLRNIVYTQIFRSQNNDVVLSFHLKLSSRIFYYWSHVYALISLINIHR